eukprot:s4604_g3.t1
MAANGKDNKLASRMWSCSELRDGLMHVISEGNDPEEVRALEDDDEELDADDGKAASSKAGPRKTRAARNAKLRRLCQRRKNGSLAVPVWLHELWKAGNHTALALQYEENGQSKYGGENEYWVQVRETGVRELAEEREQRVTQNTQDGLDHRAALVDDYSGIDAYRNRIAANEAPAVQATAAKETFRKFIDSVLSKSAKIRALIPPRSIVTLEADAKILDDTYASLADLQAKGEMKGFDAATPSCIWQQTMYP